VCGSQFPNLLPPFTFPLRPPLLQKPPIPHPHALFLPPFTPIHLPFLPFSSTSSPSYFLSCPHPYTLNYSFPSSTRFPTYYLPSIFTNLFPVSSPPRQFSSRPLAEPPVTISSLLPFYLYHLFSFSSVIHLPFLTLYHFCTVRCPSLSSPSIERILCPALCPTTNLFLLFSLCFIANSSSLPDFYPLPLSPFAVITQKT